MHALVSKFLDKRGIKDLNDMSKDEMAVFERWNSILGKDKLTVDDFEQFCRNQVAIIKSRWRRMDSPSAMNDLLIAQFNVYESLIEIINSPKAERERLERELEERIKSL